MRNIHLKHTGVYPNMQSLLPDPGGLNWKFEMTTVTVHTPVAVRVPRAAAVAAEVFANFLSWFEHKAETTAVRREATDRAAEAAAVREYAHRFASHDPSFAADLLAAADRHERNEGAARSH